MGDQETDLDNQDGRYWNLSREASTILDDATEHILFEEKVKVPVDGEPSLAPGTKTQSPAGEGADGRDAAAASRGGGGAGRAGVLLLLLSPPPCRHLCPCEACVPSFPDCLTTHSFALLRAPPLKHSLSLSLSTCACNNAPAAVSVPGNHHHKRSRDVIEYEHYFKKPLPILICNFKKPQSICKILSRLQP
ncbi:hypothetical protein NL676_009194 [Syzygium grande]|nr:hypothetical protein NL676_009194 [Syzygium grande]